MYLTQKQTVALSLSVAAVLAVCLIATVGVAVAEEPDDITFEQEFKDEQVLATDEQTLQFNITNEADEDEGEPLDQPIVEIVDSGDIEIDTDSAVIKNADIIADGDEEDRTTDELDEEESVSGDDVVIIEGENNEIDAGETVTYEIDVEVTTTGDVEVETLVYPLFIEPSDENEVRDSDLADIDTLNVESFQPGDLEIDVLDIDNDIDEDEVPVVFDDGESEIEGTGQLSQEVAAIDADGDPVEYDVGAEIPLADNDTVLLEDVTVPEVSPPRSVDFSPVEEAAEPEIIAETDPDGIDIEGLNDPVRQGTAEDPFEKEFNFDLITDGGDFAIGVDDPAVIDPFEDVEADIDDGEIVDTDDSPEESTVIIANTDDDDDIVEIVYEGFPLGDVTTTGDVTNDDATEIAQAVAAGEQDELNQLYGDVTDDGEVSAVDAMFVAQYDEGDGPRDEEYELNGGS